MDSIKSCLYADKAGGTGVLAAVVSIACPFGLLWSSRELNIGQYS